MVPYEEILAEEEAERLQMHLDLESGRITPAEMMRRNCIDLGDTTLLRRTTRPGASGGPDGDKQRKLCPIILTLTDTGPLVALFNRTDAAHGRCVDTLSEFRLA